MPMIENVIKIIQISHEFQSNAMKKVGMKCQKWGLLVINQFVFQKREGNSVFGSSLLIPPPPPHRFNPQLNGQVKLSLNYL